MQARLRLFAVLWIGIGDAFFVPSLIRIRPLIVSPLKASASDDRGGRRMWSLPNDFPMFLTQCSLQSFMCTVASLRDPQTVSYLESFTQPNLVKRQPNSNVTFSLAGSDLGDVSTTDSPKKPPKARPAGDDYTSLRSELLRYHGLAAMNTTLFPTWNSFFKQLLEQPTEYYTITTAQAHIPDYDIEIDPLSLCSRILSVREQISKEFVGDLKVIADLGGRTLDGYWEQLKESRRDEPSSDTDAMGYDDKKRKRNRSSLLFLEAWEGSDFAPSPLRKGNFDLLVLLATQEAVHRVLNDESRQEGAERATNDFLQAFYEEREHYFSGLTPYGRADDFLEELLSSSPSLKTVEEGVTSMIDPIRIAEVLLQEREQVALDWREIAIDSPRQHMVVQKLRLDRMMGLTEENDAESAFE